MAITFSPEKRVSSTLQLKTSGDACNIKGPFLVFLNLSEYPAGTQIGASGRHGLGHTSFSLKLQVSHFPCFLNNILQNWIANVNHSAF